MKTLEELINKEDPGWKVISEWISLAKNKIEILPREQKKAEAALVQTQVTTRSLLGAVIYETGGILIDHGWIRLLGSGSEKMRRSVSSWNKGKTFLNDGDVPPYLFIADDVLGGLYAINGGFLGEDAGNIYYFQPDALEWFAMDFGYTEFLLFCFDGRLDEFYEGLRWKGWEQDVERLGGDQGFSCMPFLWSKEGKDIEKVSRKAVSLDDLYMLNLEMQEKLNAK